MAQYKVPQDVEADDKLLGPFSFRQFVYLMIAGGCIALAAGLFQLFPLLAIIPLPIAFFFLALALPLKKDQPMETYLAALVSYYTKPHKRIWEAGQRDTTIQITAPKVVDDNRSRDITGEEATHRLSFLADIVDTEGMAIKGVGRNQVSEEIVAEANNAVDMFDNNHFNNLDDAIAKDEIARHNEAIRGMKEAIENNGAVEEKVSSETDKDTGADAVVAEPVASGPDNRSDANAVLTEPKTMNDGEGPDFASSTVVMPGSPVETEPVEKSNKVLSNSIEKSSKTQAKPSIIELANNTEYSVATIAKEANRIKRKEEGEVFISLH